MAWNQPGSPNNNPWGKKPAPGGGDLDQAFKDWQKRIESLFGGGGGGSATLIAVHRHRNSRDLDGHRPLPGAARQPGRGAAIRQTRADRGRRLGLAPPVAHRNRHQGRRRRRQIHRNTSRACSPPNRTWSSCRWPCSTASRMRKTISSRCAIRSHAERSERERHSRSGRAQRPAGHPRSGPHQDRRGHARDHAAHARPVRRRHRSAQREHHRRAGARGRAAGAARLGQGEGRSRTHDQGSPGLCEWHLAQGPG